MSQYSTPACKPDAEATPPEWRLVLSLEAVTQRDEMIQFGLRRSAGNHLAGLLDAFLERAGKPGNINRSTGVHLHDVARYADFIVQYTQ